MDVLDENYRNLACAIIKQASEDYERAYGDYLLGKKNYSIRDIAECESFFRSEWFVLLSNGIDGELFLKKLQEKIENKIFERLNRKAELERLREMSKKTA